MSHGGRERAWRGVKVGVIEILVVRRPVVRSIAWLGDRRSMLLKWPFDLKAWTETKLRSPRQLSGENVSIMSDSVGPS